MKPTKKRQKKWSAKQWAALTQQTKGSGSGKGAKGGGKGAKGGGKGQCKSHMADREEICYAFNDRNRGCQGCVRAHVCGVCFKKNSPMFSCNHQP